MSNTKHSTGLVSVEISKIAADGDVGTDFSVIGETVKGSANLTSTDPTVTDFDIEESDSPIESMVTTQSVIEIAWSTYNLSADQLVTLYGGTRVGRNHIASLGSITGGSLYTNGVYTDVPLTGGTGSGARATITVAGGAVTVVTITDAGTGYTAADVLSALAANIGGTGSGFAVSVATVTGANDVWSAPDSLPELERSLRVTDKKGNVVVFPRVKITSKLNVSFAKDKVGQLDIKARVLQPTKANVKRMQITYYV